MSDTIHIGVLGADGRMGGAIIRALSAVPTASLSAAITAPNSPNIGKDASELAGLKAGGVLLSADLHAGLAACDVLIDFSQPKAAIDAALAMHDTRCHTFVTGTTGYSDAEERALIGAGESITLLKSGNFSLGITMLEILVEQAAAALGDDWDIEISDMHHRHKVDAPSGTALMLGEAAARGRGAALSTLRAPVRDGIAPAREAGQIGFSAQRGGGVIGDHDVHFAAELEMITLSHRAFDRSVFARGAVTAALWAAKQSKGVYSLHDMLRG